jgi:hypothetical protein
VGNILCLSPNKTYIKVLIIHKWSFATIQNSVNIELMLRLLEMSSTTCLQSISIDTEENLDLPSQIIASFKPLASALLGCGRPLNQVCLLPNVLPLIPSKTHVDPITSLLLKNCCINIAFYCSHWRSRPSFQPLFRRLIVTVFSLFSSSLSFADLLPLK